MNAYVYAFGWSKKSATLVPCIELVLPFTITNVRRTYPFVIAAIKGVDSVSGCCVQIPHNTGTLPQDLAVP